MKIVKIPRAKYERLKVQSNIDVNLLQQFAQSLRDVKEGRIRRVK